MIKKAARELFGNIEGFNDSFENNKKLLKGTMHYKSVRNKVAGGIVKLVKKAKQKELKANKSAENDDRGTTEE